MLGGTERGRRCATIRLVDTAEFDAAAAGLDYPMFVVTTVHGGERAGCMVGFTPQASIAPPRMLICLSVKNHTHRVAMQGNLLAVHVLDSDDGPLATLFGGETAHEVDNFARVRCCSTVRGEGRR